LSLDLLLRARSGATGWVALRGFGLSRRDHALIRVRVAAGGGYTWMFGRVDVPLLAAASIEPWSVRRSSGRLVVEGEAGQQVGAPLLGALVALRPGVRFGGRIDGRPGPAVRVGAHAEFAGSFVVDGGARTVELGIETPTGREPWARLGGLDLVLGLDISVWFDLFRSRRRDAR
jgi:hypothetical protein